MTQNRERKNRRNSESRKGKQARERVLDAAYEVFVANGYSGATTDMIQAASGTSKATMYAHFRSKEILFHEMIEHQLSRSVMEYKEIGNDNNTIKDFLTIIGSELLSDVLGIDGVKMGRLMIAECTRFPLLGMLFYITGPKAITDIVEMRLSEAHRRRELHIPQPNIAAEQFVGIIKGDYYLRALLGFQTPTDTELEEYIEKTVAAFLTAYAPAREGSNTLHPECKST